MTDTQTIRAAFTELAPRYEQTVDQELRHFWGIGYEEFISLLLARIDLANAGTVLDVATGRGVVPRALLRERAWKGRLVGLDITPEMLRGATGLIDRQGGAERVTLVGGSGMRLPFSDGVFDVAICALATHHMRAHALLAEMGRVLRPGGQLLIGDVALANFWNTRIGHLALQALAWGYGRRVGKARLRAEMDALPNLRAPEEWRGFLLSEGFSNPEMITLPARRAWHPPGILAWASRDYPQVSGIDD